MKLLPQVLTIALAFTAGHAVALTADKDKNIRVQADSAVVDDKKGLSTYTGNVVVDQGTLHITADKVEIISENNEVVKVVASTADKSDQLAHYQQMPDNSKQLVQADARQITWLVKQRQLELEGDAKLSQTHDTSFSGETIHYDANKGTVNAQSGEKAQVETVFKPKKQ